MSKNAEDKWSLSPKERQALLAMLKSRFEENMARHKGLDWAGIPAKLDACPEKLWSLCEMERTGGMPWTWRPSWASSS